ncbi:MAG: cellulase family glycosylhydrolase [Prevotella sp.]|nr:cellulase family glycosylhydrolase [Prevotella sp.]
MKRHLTIICSLLLLWSHAAWGDNFESATQAVNNMKVGWNLGNTLESNGDWITGTSTEAYETAWGQPVTKPELMEMMRNAGFNAIRVPVTWYQHMDDNNQVNAEWMARVHEVVDYVIDQGMYCILNVHHDTGADDNAWLVADETVFAQQEARFKTLWTQIANEFKDYGDHLLFEGYNEMLDVADSWCFASFGTSNKYDASIATSAYNAINSYAQAFVDAVRATGGNNAQRNLVVCTYGACSGSGTWNDHLKDPLKNMNLPTDNVDGHIAFEIHSYLNVENLQNAKNEVVDMMSALKSYLASKGAPVIFGEWGTANLDTDYNERHDNMLAFAKYFVQQAKDNGFATFYWMGLSDGKNRTLPVFNQPDLAKNILQAWYGDNYEPTLPVEDDFEYAYTTVEFNSQWGELYLYNGDALNISEYTGLRLEMAETVGSGILNVKVTGGNSNESYVGVTNLETTVTFDSNKLGQTVSNITLQYQKSSTFEAKVVRAVLLKADGSEVETDISVFWGCQITDIVVTPKPEEPDMAYAVFNNGSLNFYYDNKSDSRDGTAYELNNGNNTPGWISDHKNEITSVVINQSFADALPTSTYRWFDSEKTSNTGSSNVVYFSYSFDDGAQMMGWGNNQERAIVDGSYDGSKCMSVVNPSVVDYWGSQVAADINPQLTVGETYTLHFWAKASGNASLSAEFQYPSSDAGYPSCGNFGSFDLTTEWKEYTMTATVTRDNCTRFLFQVGTFAGTMWFDDVTLSKINEAQQVDIAEIEGLEYLNTSNVTNMAYMFNGCSALTSLDISNFDTQNVTDMSGMFKDCSLLTTIYSGDSWSTAKVTASNDMFSGCTQLVGGKGTKYDETKTDATYARADKGKTNPGYFTNQYVATSIAGVKGNMENVWFSIDGQRLKGVPTQRGIYICNGRKVVVR